MELKDYSTEELKIELKRRSDFIKDGEPKNNVHFYIARDKDDSLWLFIGKPFRDYTGFHGNLNKRVVTLTSDKYFNKFGLNENDYANLKWEDEPVEVFVNMED